MEVVDTHDKYLGLPSVIRRSKREVFANIRDRVYKSLQGWKEKWLSKGGKEILIKAVIQAIPTYAMSCFKLLRYFTNEIEGLMAKFWWENNRGKGIHWIKWQDMCLSKDFGGLGFRDLDAFNTALLAKQVWRLLVSPDSLLGRIYKARYYPNSDIFGASLGSNPSYTWRSIWGAISLVERGTRWRIGNGANVSIWGDRWMPRTTTFKPFTLRRNWSMEMMVQSLIDNESGCWNMHVLSSIFNEEDIRCIMSIPLGSSANEDKIIWHYNQNGVFTVRSAYHLALQIENETLGLNTSSSSSSISTGSWKWLWSLKLPSKIKNFLWRSCKNLLPTRLNLVKRKVLEAGTCEVCGDSDEDILHCLSMCSFARQVWALSGVPWSIHWPREQRVLDWILRMRKQQDNEQFEYCVVLCWAIWNKRNKCYFEGVHYSAMDIIAFAKKFIVEVRGAFSVVLSPQSSQAIARSPIHWEAPPMDAIKINFDASLCSDENSCGLGGLARSFDGSCIAWFSTCCNQRLDPATAEAMAALRAVEFARDHNMHRIVLESDSSTIVASIQSGVGSLYSFDHLIDDIKRLSFVFEDFKVRHIKRGGNRAAHEITKLSIRSTFMTDVLPDFISDIVLYDTSS